MLKAVIFDMDHTLIDWDSVAPGSEKESQDRRLKGVFDYVHANVYPLTGIDPQRFSDLFSAGLESAWVAGRESLVSPNIFTVLTDLLVSCGVPGDKIDLDVIMQVYDWQAREGEQAYPDALDVLPELHAHGIKLGLITNSSHPMIYRDRELQAAGLLHLLSDCRLSSFDVGYFKPHRSIFERALEILGIDPDEAVFVGDNLEADIRGAQGAGMYGVLRVRADQTEQETDGIIPDGTITTMHDLLPLLDGWYPGWRNGQ
jgi:putative hydrolase of the HAD superfamily